MNSSVLELQEWTLKLPEKGNELYHRFLDDNETRKTATRLTEKGYLEITELKDGLKVVANSYVGRLRLGTLQINIRPKLQGMPLYRLLRYAYGLRDMELFAESLHYIDSSSLYDLLLYQLAAEAERLIAQGLNKTYLRRAEDLQSPRGRIDLRKLAYRGGLIASTLPCIYFDRIEDNLLNRVLYAGLRFATVLAENLQLKIKLNQLCQMMSESVTVIEVNKSILDIVLRQLNRLNEDYRPALEIISILYESWGLSEEDGFSVRLQGFLFDMNRFFQRLLSRLLKDFLDGYKIKEEFKLHGMFQYNPEFNPLRRKAPTPRPDFAVMKGNQVLCLIDAKYRDLWENTLPADMLYQLAVYALSGKGNYSSKILYPTMSKAAKVQKVDIVNPITGGKQHHVILQPVLLPKLAELLDNKAFDRSKCARYIREITLEH